MSLNYAVSQSYDLIELQRRAAVGGVAALVVFSLGSQ